MKTIYLVRVYKDETRGFYDCVDDNYYCAGVYSQKENAIRRSTNLESKGEDVEIIEIEIDVDIPVYEGYGDLRNKGEEEIGLWLGGGYYYG